jgi:hypothetical protein
MPVTSLDQILRSGASSALLGEKVEFKAPTPPFNRFFFPQQGPKIEPCAV